MERERQSDTIGDGRFDDVLDRFAMEGCRMMLKKCSIGRLREGMILGRDVYKDDMTVLLGEGTVLTSKMLDSLADHDIFSVYIQAEDEEEAISAPNPPSLGEDEERG